MVPDHYKLKLNFFLLERVILFEIPFTQINLFFNVWGKKSDIASLNAIFQVI